VEKRWNVKETAERMRKSERERERGETENG